MNDRAFNPGLPTVAILTITITITTALLAATSCSTIAEPAVEGPPVCDCDPGERKLDCRTGDFDAATDIWTGQATRSEFSILCIDAEATDEEKDQVCLDGCNEWLGDTDGWLYCGFLSDSEHFRWTGCVAPEAATTSAGAGLDCPGWYTPDTSVSNYEQPTPAWATVSVDQYFIDQIAIDPLPLYLCDSARYAESKTGDWTFIEVEPSSLLHRLGIRSGDRNAVICGVDPATQAPVTASYRLDSIDGVHQAYGALLDAEAIHLSVQRSNAPNNLFDLWVTLER